MKSTEPNQEYPEKEWGLENGEKINLEGMHRLVNHDGSFNIIKKRLPGAFLHNFYHDLIAMPWSRFGLVMVSIFIALMILFSGIYFGVSIERHPIPFLDAFFFSAQTLTTVDLGCEPPPGTLIKFIAIVESLLGITTFALVTGICYARFAKPDAKIRFSKNMLIAPHQGVTALQLKICNMRKSQLIDTEANIIFSYWKTINNKRVKKYEVLNLETDKVNLFPLPWVIVHPIDQSSPLWGMTALDLEKSDAEFLILIKSYDDSFSQSVNIGSSYKYYDLVWGAKFKINYDKIVNNKIVIEMDKMDDYEIVTI